MKKLWSDLWREIRLSTNGVAVTMAVAFSEFSQSLARGIVMAVIVALCIPLVWWVNTHDVVREIALFLVGLCGDTSCEFAQVYTGFGVGVIMALDIGLLLVVSIARGVAHTASEAEQESQEMAELREMLWSVRVDQKRIADYLGDADIQVVDTGVMDYERLQAD